MRKVVQRIIEGREQLGFCGLWQHRDFRQLWSAQSVSLLGSQVTLLALPLTAVLTLNASPLAMGVLSAAQTLLWRKS